MTHPLLQGYKQVIWYSIVCGILGGIQAIVYQPIVPVSYEYLLIDGILSFLLFAIVSIPLWMIVQYVNNSKQSRYQNYINTLIISIVYIAVWLGANQGILAEILPDTIFSEFHNVLYIKIGQGILMYSVIYLYFINVKLRQSIEELPDESCNEIQKIDNVDYIDKVTVKSGQKITVILVKDIIYIEAEGDYVMIYTESGKYLKEQTMKYFEMYLPSDLFLRIHRSVIINIHCISSIQLLEKQSYILVLKTGAQVKASNSGYKLLKQRLGI